MKVCTDACLFGAWAAGYIARFHPKATSILDIGTGTGLLSLMLAQKIQAHIDTVEIDKEAASQARENFIASPWDNISLHNTSILEFKSEIKYDVIITNPPFYEGSLLSPIGNRNAAMHDRYLTLEDVIQSVLTFLAEKGYAAILLPFSREAEFCSMLSTHPFFIAEIMRVRQSVNHTFFRSMLFISRERQPPTNYSAISIHNHDRSYTQEFKELLKDYYLKL